MSNEIIKDGRTAMTAVRRGDATWRDWRAVGHALLEGRELARRNSGKFGLVHVEREFSTWCRDNRFNISPTTRGRLMHCMDHIAQIEAWRSTLSDERRERLRTPSVVWSRYYKSVRQTAAAVSATPSHGAPAP